VIDADRDFATMREFIVGRLPDSERRAFEDRLVREPALVRELEQSLRMREGLEQLRAQGYFANGPLRGASLRWVPLLVAAAGAGVALFLWLAHVAGPSPILIPSLESSTTADMRSSVAAHFTFISMRGSRTPDLDLPAAGLIEIRAAPSFRATTQRYRVTLLRQEDGGRAQAVAAVDGLSTGTDGYVHCYADSSRLSPGSYLLRVEPEANVAGAAEAFAFNLRSGVTGAPR
jgi:hypothetical protein